MREFVLIGLGAVLGANLRYWIANVFADRFGPGFPYGTLFINITGSFVLGLVLTLAANRFTVDPGVRLTLGTGFLGAFTTFSTFSFDAVALVERGDLMPATIYAGASLLGSIVAAFVGIWLARALG